MEYSPLEGLILAVSEVLIDAYHSARERPRAFWGLWAVCFSVAALVCLRPRRRDLPEALTAPAPVPLES